MAERAVLHIILLLFTINGLHSKSLLRGQSLGILSELLGKDTKNPLIVVVDTAKHAGNLDVETALDDDRDELIRDDDHMDIGDDDRLSAEKVDSIKSVFNALIKDNYHSIPYDILRTEKVLEHQTQQKTQEKMIAQALRSRCEAINECEDKCSQKKKQNSCQKSCKSDFDELLKCPKKKKENTCPATGKTCKPSWGY